MLIQSRFPKLLRQKENIIIMKKVFFYQFVISGKTAESRHIVEIQTYL